ncbi:NAD(P)H-binding protein [Conexibacter sp. W3-3-2]|uniref:NAD(P)H-binding protein n=1 Tax=Conexibacter sp. W3-3-2 TaxID=2675227 RepID=UPI001E427F56|nr:NAD(P)H-binding protein [Conexibacter sp. W3-3-2]
MQTLVTGASGYLGDVLVPVLQQDDHDVRAFARTPAKVRHDIPIVQGDVVTGEGLDAALDGIEVAYYLVHSMEGGSADFDALERRSAENFADAARRAGVRRIVYMGGPVPEGKEASRHLASRVAVEEILLEAAPESVAFRASLVIGRGSRSFRFLVRLVERSPCCRCRPGTRAARGRSTSATSSPTCARRAPATRSPGRCRSTSPAPTRSPTGG